MPRPGSDVAGNATDEQVADAGVHRELRGGPGVGATEYSGEGLLAADQLLPKLHGLIGMQWCARNEPLIAFLEAAKSLLGRFGPR